MKLHLLLISLLFISFSLSAKTAEPVKVLENYIYFDGGGGIHGLSYNLIHGKESGQLGSTFNVGFCYSYNHDWALKVGLGLQSYSSQSVLNGADSIKSIDADGKPQAYMFRAKYSNVIEDQKAMFLDLPVGIQYRKILHPKFTLQAASGLIFSIPLTSSFKTSSGQISSSGYYSQTKVILDDVRDQGFGNYTESFSGKLALYPALSLFFDLGALYHINEKADFYLGTYFNYGLTDLQKAQKKFLFQPANGPQTIYNGVIASTETNRVNSFSFGVKAGIYIGFEPPKPSHRAAPAKGGSAPRRSANRR